MTCERNPCAMCRNYTETYDRETGWSDRGCWKDDEFFETQKGPCRHFEGYLPTDDLYEQLFWEDEN